MYRIKVRCAASELENIKAWLDENKAEYRLWGGDGRIFTPWNDLFETWDKGLLTPVTSKTRFEFYIDIEDKDHAMYFKLTWG